MNQKFKVELLEEVSEFLGSLNEKTRDKRTFQKTQRKRLGI